MRAYEADLRLWSAWRTPGAAVADSVAALLQGTPGAAHAEVVAFKGWMKESGGEVTEQLGKQTVAPV